MVYKSVVPTTKIASFKDTIKPPWFQNIIISSNFQNIISNSIRKHW